MCGLRYQSSAEGFTLIEVLLAILIGSVVLTVLYTSFFQIIKAKDKIENELEMYHEAYVILARINKDLINAFPRGMVNSFAPTDSGPFFIGTEENGSSSIRFTSLSRIPAQEARDSDQTEISYFLQEVPESDLYALIRRDNPQIGNETAGREYEITDKVAKFNLKYLTEEGLGADTREFANEWNSTVSSSIPMAVEIYLVLRSPYGEDVEFNSLITIPVAK